MVSNRLPREGHGSSATGFSDETTASKQLTTATDSELLNVFDRVESWVFDGPSRFSYVLRELQRATGLSRRVFFYLVVGVFHLMLLSSNSTAALSNLFVIAYPLYLTVKHLMNPDIQVGPLLVFWSIYAIYTQMLFVKPHGLLLAVQPGLFFYLWCPATQGARNLHFRMFAPVCELFVQEKFSPDLWVQMYPWLARLFHGAGLAQFGYLKERFSAAQLAELKACLKRAMACRADLNSTRSSVDLGTKSMPLSEVSTAISAAEPSSTATAIAAKTPKATTARAKTPELAPASTK